MQGRARLGVLASGSGSNLEAIFQAAARPGFGAEVAVVICNKPDVLALSRAAQRDVPTQVVLHGAFPTRQAFDAELVRCLREHHVDLVVLAGFMRIVTDTLLSAFPDRVVNIHPALLPAFPGVHGPKQALDYGVKVAGCTVHFVDQGTDTGPVIAQTAVPVLEDDTESSLAARILAEEHRLLPAVIDAIAKGRVHVDRTAGPRPRVRIDAPGIPALDAGDHGA